MTTDTDKALSAPSNTSLFFSFLMLGLSGFGGVLPLARRMLVEKKQWLNSAEFTELVGLCQFLPGGNIVNLTVAVGMQYRGIPGVFCAFTGLMCAPTAIVVALGSIYARYQNNLTVKHLFAGLAAAAAGLLLSTTMKMLLPFWRQWLPMLVASITVLAMAWFKFPLLATMLVLTPISILLVWRKAS